MKKINFAPPKVVLSAPLESTSRSDLSVIINSTSKSTPSRHRFSFSPISSCYEKSPVLSPIEFETQEEAHASTSFMKDQDLSVGCLKEKLNQKFEDILAPVSSTGNINLEKRLCVQTVLKELELSNLEALFEEQEIDLLVFLTLNDNDLKCVGVENIRDRKKIVDFIADFNSRGK